MLAIPLGSVIVDKLRTPALASHRIMRSRQSAETVLGHRGAVFGLNYTNISENSVSERYVLETEQK